MELYRNSLFSDANLQGYWKLENTDDESANNYDLTNTGSVAFSAGKFNNAPTFDGTAKYLSIAGASCANLNISGSQTICFWFKPSGLGDNWRMILGKAKDDLTTGFVFSHYTTNASVSLRIYGLGGGGGYVDGDVTMSNGTWYFICGRFNATAGTVDLFINSTRKGNTSVTGTVTSSASNQFAIGLGGDYSGTGYAKGMIDDVAIFNRALTDTEVSNLYAATLVKTYNALAIASVKTVNGLAIASVKHINKLP